jgi:uncharacterized protein YuzE
VTFHISITPTGRKTVAELRGKARKSFDAAVDRLASDGCEAGDYKLAGEGIEHICSVQKRQPLARSRIRAILRPMSDKFAYYDREADIAWLPTGDSADVVSEEVEWGLIDHDSATDEVVAIEVWSASKRLPAEVLATLPAPASAHGAAA